MRFRLWHSTVSLFAVNPQLKVVSLVLAVGIQLAVQRSSVQDVTLTLPVQMVGVPAGQAYVGSLPDRVRLRVRGRRVALAELEANVSKKLSIDLTSYRDGERYVFEPRALSQLPPLMAVEVVAVEPASLDVRLEALETRTLPVEIVLSGQAAPGFRVSSRNAQLQPDSVRVSGPASRLRHWTAVRTLPIDISGADKDMQVHAHLAGGDERVRFEPDEVAVKIRVEEAELARVLANQPVVIRNCPPNSRCSIDPSEVNVKVEGLAAAVRAFVDAPPENLLVADLTHPLRSGDSSVKIEVHTVRGLMLTPAAAFAKFSVLRQIEGGAAAPPETPPAK